MDKDVIIQEVGNLLLDLLNNNWQKILLYVEVEEDDSCEVYFCIKDDKTGSYVDYNDIQIYLELSRSDMIDIVVRISRLSRKLKAAMTLNNESHWSSYTYSIEKDMDFEIDFSYEDLDETSVRLRRKRWKEKYLQ